MILEIVSCWRELTTISKSSQITETWDISEAEQLNPRLASWALFFTRFDFIVTKQPGIKNCKADALSHLYHPEPNSSPPEPVLPSAMVVSPIQWSLDDQLIQATHNEPAPLGGPEGWLYVPFTCTQQTPLWALDTQAASEPSCSFKITTYGPTWPRISPSTSRGTQSVPSQTHRGSYSRVS